MNKARSASKGKGGSQGNVMMESNAQISPKTVLVATLVFVSCVVLLHFYEKLRYGNKISQA